MTHFGYCVNRLTNFFADAITADPSCIPSQVLAIKEAVEDFFGIENVELQPTRLFDDCQWNEALGRITFAELCRQCGVPMGLPEWSEIDLSETACEIIYQKNNEFFDKFMNRVNLETMLHSDYLPLFTILIKFKNITVTNENNLSTVINEMFAKFSISPTGRIVGMPHWIRTVYTYEHYCSHYSHSHLPYSALDMDFGSSWYHPCLGRGPIVLTLHTLQDEFNIDMWPLLCRELDVCIRTESLAGGPYRFIREIEPLTTDSVEIEDMGIPASYQSFTKDSKNRILSKVLKSGKLKWVYQAGHYELANDFCELNVLLTQAYLDDYMEVIEMNEHTADELLTQGVLYLGYFTPQGTIKRIAAHRTSFGGRTFSTRFSFKGIPVDCRILPYNPYDGIDHSKTMLLLNTEIISLLHKLLILLANSVYGNK